MGGKGSDSRDRRTPSGVDWEQEAGRLLERSWLSLRILWLGVAPTSPMLGRPPEIALGDLPSLAAVADTVDENLGLRADVEPVGLREGMLREAVFLLHKAAHVLGAAQVHVSRGVLTWSQSSAYQAANFAMRSILMLLGIAVIEVGKNVYLVDCWAPVPSRGTTARQRRAPPAVLFRKVRRADHKAMWTIFRRMLWVAKVAPEIWPPALVTALRKLEPSDFSHQRNRLHYRNCDWPGDDLHAYRGSETFGVLSESFYRNEVTIFDSDAEDFSLTLGLTLVMFAARLARDLAATSNIIADEVALVRSLLGQDVLASYAAAALA